MLSPSRVKYRKVQKGHMRGQAKAGTEVSFGDFGLQTVECGWLTCPPDRGRPYRYQPSCEAWRQALYPGLSRQARVTKTR